MRRVGDTLLLAAFIVLCVAFSPLILLLSLFDSTTPEEDYELHKWL